jgi:hypothetical protein
MLTNCSAVKPSSVYRNNNIQIFAIIIDLLSVWAIANAVTLIGREFPQLVYIFEFLIETQGSNRHVEKLSGFCFESEFPRLTEEGYSNHQEG